MSRAVGSSIDLVGDLFVKFETLTFTWLQRSRLWMKSTVVVNHSSSNGVFMVVVDVSNVSKTLMCADRGLVSSPSWYRSYFARNPVCIVRHRESNGLSSVSVTFVNPHSP